MQKKILFLLTLFIVAFIGYFITYLKPFSQKPIIGDRRLIKYKESSQQKSMQVVLLIMDSMRYEFIDRIHYFRQMVEHYPDRSSVSKLIASDPTDTLTNIRTMMTGSNLFGYGKIFQMISADRIFTDNLFKHLEIAQKQVAVLGDPVWIRTFEFKGKDLNCFKVYDIFDEQTCDKKIHQNFDTIVKQQKQNSTNFKYDFVVAHFLSLDHTLHIKGVGENDKLPIILQDVNKIFQNKTEVANKQTMLFILGDHGMTQKGSHAGVSPYQKETLLFSLYKPEKYKAVGFQQPIILDAKIHQENQNKRAVRMLDIASTLSILLNIPCPANSIGYPLLHVLPQLYHKYFPQIQFNVLQQYKEFIDYYKIENTFQCRDIHKWIADSEANLDKIHEPSFYFQRRQLIIDNLFNNCLTQISLADPLIFSWCFIVFGLFLISLLWLKAFPKEERSFDLQFLKQQSIWLSSKFLIFFSSYLIFYELPYLGFLIVFFILINNKMNLISKIISIVLLILMGQMQNMIFDFDSHGIFFIKGVTTQISNSVKLLLICIIIWGSTEIYKTISHFLSIFQKCKLSQQKCPNLYQQCINKYKSQFGKSAIFAMICMIFMTMAQILLVAYSIFNAISFYLTKNIDFAIRSQFIKYLLLYFIVRIVYQILSIRYQKQTNNIHKQTKLNPFYSYKFNINLLLITVFSHYLQIHQLVLIILFQMAIGWINANKMNMMLSYLLAEMTWRSMGFNYRFSTLRVQKSYTFSSQFSIIGNGLTYAFYLAGLHFIALAKIYSIARNKSFEIYQNITEDSSLELKQIEQNSLNYEAVDSNESSSVFIDETAKNQWNKQQKDQDVLKQLQSTSTKNHYDILSFWKEIPKYILIPITGFISAQLNLSFRTGRQSSMGYTIIMIIQLIELQVVIALIVVGIVRILIKQLQSQISKIF